MYAIRSYYGQDSLQPSYFFLPEKVVPASLYQNGGDLPLLVSRIGIARGNLLLLECEPVKRVGTEREESYNFV